MNNLLTILGIHQHQPEPVAVQHVTVKGAPVTYVLYRCTACGDVHSEELDGTWTLYQIRGSARPDEAGRV